MVKLTTADKVAAVAPDIRAKIAKRSRTKGSNYEREVAKKIANYFGEEWSSCFFRTKPHGMAQPNGDIQPINKMYDRWRGAKLGPIECKNRAVWSFDQLFKNPERSELYRYWKKSNEDTKSNNTVLVFTKNGVSDFVMTVDSVCAVAPYLLVVIPFDAKLIIQTLPNFLAANFFIQVK